MARLRVGAAALNQTPLDWDKNCANIKQVIAAARAQGVELLCLPELCLTGYGCEDTFLAPSTRAMAFSCLKNLLPDTKDLVVSFGVPVAHEDAVYNTACLVADGQILGFVGKKNLASTGVYYEPRWFKAWPEGKTTTVTFDGHAYPLGDIYFDLGGVKVGFEICEDAWVKNRPGQLLSQVGVDVILNPSASHFAFGRREVRREFVLNGSRLFGCAYIYANLLGLESGRIIFDGDCLIASGGELIAESVRFGFKNFSLTQAEIECPGGRKSIPATDGMPTCIPAPAHSYFGRAKSKAPSTQRADWEQSEHLKEEEFTRAVSLALFDYLRKSRTQGFVVSLSGGADSSGVSVLVSKMIELGLAELGSEFREKLGHLTGPAPSDQQSWTKRLLTCVYQRTRNNTEITRAAARGVAQALGATFFEFEVDKFVDEYVALVSQAINRPLSWEKDDVALQNVQARARVPAIWLLANERGALLLTTSNRSEAAVGYATMDGDTAGGLNPIGGIDKAFLREWLKWIERRGPLGGSPIPALKRVTEQAPTAELRPIERAQTDEADLMPYVVLDQIERCAIRDKQSPLETFRTLEHELEAKYSSRQLGQWVDRFFQLWCLNQWKRERLAPSFHLDDENLDPKTWCRFPILSGNYEWERAELRKYLETLS